MMRWLEAHWIAVFIHALIFLTIFVASCLTAQSVVFRPLFEAWKADYFEERLQAYRNQLRDMEHAYAVLVQERDHLSEVLRHCRCANDGASESERLRTFEKDAP